MLPKAVKVHGRKIQVRETDKFPEELDQDTLGLADLLSERILIHKQIPAAAKKQVLLHEICHVALFQSGVSQTLSLHQEEAICQLFAFLYDECKRQKL
jgi:predicted metallopeptidase